MTPLTLFYEQGREDRKGEGIRGRIKGRDRGKRRRRRMEIAHLLIST